ncbi:D-alanyl-D-alanine dipeptidase [Celerinatantimonas sp. YJH-8]|uniref:D-alanyl-D-alanine dipeptidase n=1 Tax=Celerinatantimonas sp. YJH-8 TaxID=3228714 RepID=UPI0038C9F3DB
MHTDKLADVSLVFPEILLDIKYATDDNLTGQPIYKAPHCWVHPQLIEHLAISLHVAKLAGFQLKIFDGYRPTMAQQRLWEALPDPRYVADISLGSNHSRGIAIDLTLVDQEGHELDMGTGFDDMSEHSHPLAPSHPVAIQRNRLLLNAIMLAGGFQGLATEWWHFELPNALDYPVLPDQFDCY